MSKVDMVRSALEASHAEELVLLDERNGWPSIVGHDGIADGVNFAIHIAPVGDFHRNPNEMRFQNPGSNRPVLDDSGIPILLGIEDSEEPVLLVAADAQTRVGRTTRFSVRIEKSMIPKARQEGAAVFTNGSGERITAFRAEFLPSFLAATAAGYELPATRINEISDASGLRDENTDAAAERARRAASILIRDQTFGAKVRNAYGNRCAMCGLAAGLTVGAHIYPASAAGSPYSTDNGVCLCENHHRAYDAFKIWFDPETFEIRFRPDVIAEAGGDPYLKAFLDGTFDTLKVPDDPAQKPLAQYVNQRRQYFDKDYDWLNNI